MKFFFIFSLLTATAQAAIVDGTDNIIRIQRIEGYLHFQRCRLLQEQVTDCRLLNPDHGLEEMDFARLREILAIKSKHASASHRLMRNIEWGLIALTTVTILVAGHKLYQKGVIKLFRKHDHHDHGLWHRLSQYFPSLDFKQAITFFFRDQQWLLPTITSQVAAFVASHQKRVNNADKRTIYEFLQTELQNISRGSESDGKIYVRSLSTIEFMIYEVIRLKRVAENEK